ncbi:MAG: MFS transporter [Rikenellaceae bacterium]|jgi:FHS family L-fucose permease-like MFS transporter|nr:MFS transporter [Rikenellaceae bacterium]
MTTTQKQGGNIIGIVTMIFLFGMISFVTNLAAPIGVIWKNTPGFENLGSLGNLMNFLAYLFMGIPAGKLLLRIGYKKTALAAIAVGLVGIFVQFLSGKTGDVGVYVYLAGAFIAGISVCLLNTVVNPMLNLLGGGGNKGNQLIQTGGAFNSLMATITPMMVGAMIGEAAKAKITDVNPLLFIAMGVFALTFVILLFIPITNPTQTAANVRYESSAWKFRHLVLGAVAIFCYVGVEVGIPATLIYYLSDASAAGAGLPAATAAATAGAVAGLYWLLMMVGRFVGAAIGAKVSSKAMMTFTTLVAAILVLAAIFTPATVQTSMPAFTGSSFIIAQVPMSALLLVLCGICTSIMWGSIFNLATEGLGKYTPQASGIFMTMVVGGGVIPFLQEQLAGTIGWMGSYWLIVAAIAYMLFYALVGSKNVNRDIKVD